MHIKNFTNDTQWSKKIYKTVYSQLINVIKHKGIFPSKILKRLEKYCDLNMQNLLC